MAEQVDALAVAQEGLFWFFSVAMLSLAGLVVLGRKPMNSAMALIGMFLCMSGLFILLNAFFAALIQVLVYAGAVMVLFLFVVMLLDVATQKEQRPTRVHAFLGLLLGGALSFEFWLALQQPLPEALQSTAVNMWEGGIVDVIKPLFTRYLLPLELVGLILLVAMIGVTNLARQHTRGADK